MQSILLVYTFSVKLNILKSENPATVFPIQFHFLYYDLKMMSVLLCRYLLKNDD